MKGSSNFSCYFGDGMEVGGNKVFVAFIECFNMRSSLNRFSRQRVFCFVKHFDVIKSLSRLRAHEKYGMLTTPLSRATSSWDCEKWERSFIKKLRNQTQKRLEEDIYIYDNLFISLALLSVSCWCES